MKLFQLYPKALAHLTCKSPTENGKRKTESAPMGRRVRPMVSGENGNRKDAILAGKEGR